MPRNNQIVRRSVRSACVHRSCRPLRLPAGPTTLLVAGIFIALMSCDMAAACGWYRVRSACVSPCVVVSCSPCVYYYNPCASSYCCESWSVTWETGCGVPSAGCDGDVVTTPTLAEPHAAQRPPTPETPAPSLEPTESPSPADLPTVMDQPVTPPAAAEAPAAAAPPNDWAPFDPADQATPPAEVTPAVPLQPATPVAPETAPPPIAAPAAVEQPSAPAATEAVPTTPAEPRETAPPATAPDDLFGAPAAAPAEPPASSPPAAAPQAAPAGQTPEEKLEGLFDAAPAQTPPATEKAEEKGSTDSLENLFNDTRQDRPAAQQQPATGGLASRQLRRWTDNTGRYSCQGRLLQTGRNAVRILKQNGHTTTVPLNRLSQLDMAFVRAEVLAAAERDGVRVAQN